MDPRTVFCPNLACSARGQTGHGNITRHSRKEQRWRCRVCGRTFTSSQGTPLYRLRTSAELVGIVVALLAHGCPVQAIVAAFGYDERTVKDWQSRAGQHCEQVHHDVIQGQARDLGQVQADEIRVKVQGGVVWMAMAIMVSTRLWLDGVISVQRDMDLVSRLAHQVRRCALCRPMLLCVDGLISYVQAFQDAFRTPIHLGQRGRPRLAAWPDVNIAQVIKPVQGKRVVNIVRRIVQGSADQVAWLLHQSQAAGVLNVAYIERLNATFRQRLAWLARRSRALARQPETLHAAMYLLGTVYNLCTYHHSLRVAIVLPRHRRHWVPRTPAMAAGITDHRWTMHELLNHRIPPPPFVPPKRRGRPPKMVLSAVAL
jgi:transposase-like protein